ncbi:SAM-dependent methyltransferase [Thalassotalea euphylliae]|uniref:SAM-dependent methyltransferase n=1 Tax=Thalassotalea euphylliae TaxID=1655234 RepID=UPI00363BC7E5
MAGSLVCVGIGMTLGAHITPIAKTHIEQADVIFSLVSSGVVEQWVEAMHHDVRSLQPYYAEGKSRRNSYHEMQQAMLDEVQAGKKVVGVFYGHPGVFAQVPHNTISMARELGYSAHMEAGISAEDTLFADLGIDPGKTGCQHYETSQFMFFKRNIDTAALLVLWQVGMAGDQSLEKYTTDSRYRQVLVNLLSQYYPLNHEVIIYEAAVLPIEKVREERVLLKDLISVEVSQQTTLVIPPATALEPNDEILHELTLLDTKQPNPFRLVK